MVLSPPAPVSRSENFTETSSLKITKDRVEQLLRQEEIEATVIYGPDSILVNASFELQAKIKGVLEQEEIINGIKFQ